MATDADVEDMLTYTLWYGTSAANITTKGKSSNPTKQGETVRIEQNVGLSNDTMYYFKVVVTDGTDEVTSEKCNESTYCKGEYCSGVSYSYETCTRCDSNHKVTCPSCQGSGYQICGRMRERTLLTVSDICGLGEKCAVCGQTIVHNSQDVYEYMPYCSIHWSTCRERLYVHDKCTREKSAQSSCLLRTYFK